MHSCLGPYDHCARPQLSSTAMRTTKAMRTGHSFPASTIIQWYRAQTGGFRFVIPCLLFAPLSICAFHPISLAPTRVRPGVPPRRPLSSPLARPRRGSHSPSSCSPRARPVPVPCALLVLLALLTLLRALYLRCRPEALKRRHRRIRQASGRPRRTGSSSALQRSCPTTATATSGGSPNWSTSPCSSATHLPACNWYAGWIRVFLTISRALSVCMRGRAASRSTSRAFAAGGRCSTIRVCGDRAWMTSLVCLACPPSPGAEDDKDIRRRSWPTRCCCFYCLYPPHTYVSSTLPRASHQAYRT
ncbi:hypothetical protein DFH09DRAFT_1174050 [Mycena vulgaris]|nr:hypothetical protein DFH09DRAFT_1174050 [Mycena vulgaris]